MHGVLVEVLRLDGLESPRTDVQVDHCDEAALLMNPREQLRGEMQTGRRCGDTAVVRRVDRLIALLIGFRGTAFDVRRQRYFPVPREGRACVEVAHKANTPQPSA